MGHLNAMTPRGALREWEEPMLKADITIRAFPAGCSSGRDGVRSRCDHVSVILAAMINLHVNIRSADRSARGGRSTYRV